MKKEGEEANKKTLEFEPLTVITHICKSICLTASHSLYLSHRPFRNIYMNSVRRPFTRKYT